MSDAVRSRLHSTEREIGTFFSGHSEFGYSYSVRGRNAETDATQEQVRPRSILISIASEASLAKIWDTPEEDEAWKDL